MAKKAVKKKVTRPKNTQKANSATSKPKPGSGRADYPRHSLNKALRIPRAILDQNAGKACSVEEAAAFVGVSNSGPFGVEVSSATKFGLIERPETGLLAPTDLAKRILRPQSSSDELEGRRAAVLQAPQISDVYKHYRGENLPDEQFFKNLVVESYKVPPEKFIEFKQLFTDSLVEAKLLESHAGGKTRVIDVTGKNGDTGGSSDHLRKISKGVEVSPTDTCFVMQPFKAPLGGYYDLIYKPAIEKAGLVPIRADDDIFATGKIIDQIWSGIVDAKVLVCELTGRNPNVFYELGLAHALHKPVVLISSNEEDVPFDLQHIRVVYYDLNDPFWGKKLMDKVAENILSAIKNPEEAIFSQPGVAIEAE